MKLIASIILKMKKAILPQFISTLYKCGIDINLINLTASDGKWENYNIEIIYSSKKDLMRFIETLKKNSEFFQEIEITSTLEDKIKGGVLLTSGKIEIDNINDVSTALIGGNKLIHEKIDSGFQKNYCSCFSSVALIGGLKNSPSSAGKTFYHLYADSERDSILIKKFTDRNAYPLIIKYGSIEDMIKTVKGAEENFCCLRIMNNDDDDYLLANITDVVSKPLLFRELDEIPVHLLSVILTAVKKHEIIPGDTSVGIIGLDNSTRRLTALLAKCGFMKVLGYDGNERRMMSFEGRNGLATSIENVITNSDIVLIVDETVSYNYTAGFRTGQVIITSVHNDIADQSILKEKGVREFIRIEETDSLSLLPAMIEVIILSLKRFFSDEMLIEIAELVSGNMDGEYSLPDIFSDISVTIQNHFMKDTN